MVSPDSLLQSTNCLAQGVTVSDQGATILLRTTTTTPSTTTTTTTTSKNDDGTSCDPVDVVTVSSILKLTVLPIHMDVLQPTRDTRGLQVKDLETGFTPNETFRIKHFLSLLSFEPTSESGAEYSFYNAIPKSIVNASASHSASADPDQDNDDTVADLSSSLADLFQSHPLFRVELISPASEKQIRRVLPAPAVLMFEETPKLYQEIVAPYIQGVVNSGSLGWIENVVSGTKEPERLLLDTPDYILNIDTKWKTHPDPFTVPKDQWHADHNQPAVRDLYCLGIVKDRNLASIRDLRAEHIPMLQDVLLQCPRVIQDVYGVHYNELRIFFHYHPQFYRLHIHFTRIHNEFGCTVEKGHLLRDVIQNLEMDGEYYVKRTMTYKLGSNDTLAKLIHTK